MELVTVPKPADVAIQLRNCRLHYIFGVLPAAVASRYAQPVGHRLVRPLCCRLARGLLERLSACEGRFPSLNRSGSNDMTRRDAARLGQRPLLAITALLLTADLAHAATYYVRMDGNNANAGIANSASGAWRTIDYAADHAGAGDVIRVQAGSYSERVSPSMSGTAGNTITLVADGAVTFCGMDITNKNYLRVIGFTIDTDAGCVKATRDVELSGINTGLEFWNNTLRDAYSGGISGGTYDVRAHNSIVVGNLFTALGGGGICASALSLRGNNNFVAYNEVDGVDCDAFQIDGVHGWWLNNYLHNVLDSGNLHADFFQGASSTLGLSDNLFEANLQRGNGTLPNEHGVHMSNAGGTSCEGNPCGPMTDNLWRRNVWTKGGPFGATTTSAGPITKTRIVHDSIVDAMRYQDTHASSQSYSVWWGGGYAYPASGYVFNTLFYNGWTNDLLSSGIQPFYTDSLLLGANYNLAYTPTNTPTYTTLWTAQANPRTNVNPRLVDVAGADFHLSATSGARAGGGPLTTVNGSGSGTTFTVTAGGGGFFRGPNLNIRQYGGALTAGDAIVVGSTPLTIASVSGDAITVTSAFTWTNGQPVYWGRAVTPDIGAYPYNTGGYTLTATYARSTSTVTVTPSDASLVRFVVCYENGIPTTVDNFGPYTCSVGNGTLDVRVYPLYAGSTLYVSAAPAGTVPLPPSNVRIIGQ